MHSEMSQDDHDKIFEMILAGWATQAVRTLAALSVAEHLEAGPLSAHQIAGRESSDPDMTYRVLRAGAAMGLLEYDADAAVFSGTRMLRVLHKDSPVSLKHFAQSAPAETYWLPLVHMPETVARGENYVTEVLGGSVFEYYERHKEAGRLFGAGMTDVSTPVIREAVVAIDAADARSVVDIGGANGTFVAELLVRHPQLTGVVLELPQAIPGVAEEARRHNLGRRMTGAEGDFFVEVPAADIYLLKFILHDWDDESCRTILRNIRRAMNPGARVVIVEMSVAQNAVSAALLDLLMMTAFAGKERDESEFERLLEAADLKAARITPLNRPYQLIEAVAA